LTWAHNGADGGDFLAAALTAGVPHPTGYPTHQLLLRLAVLLDPGQPARAGAWLSALSAALAVALLTDLARRMVRPRFAPAVQTNSPQRESGAAAEDSKVTPAPLGSLRPLRQGPSHPATTTGSLAALLAGLAWAASPLLWNQATIVEVYALNALFCVAILWLLWRWGEAVDGRGAAARWLALGGLVFGLGLGNHVTLALMLPGALYWLWAKGRGAPLVRRGLAGAAGAVAAGLLVYGYLPLTASGRPAINWGDPATLDRFLWVVTGRLYGSLPFGLPLANLPARLGGWAAAVVTALTPLGFVGALVGLYLLERRLRAWWAATLLVWLAFTVYAIGYNSTDSDAYLLPAFAVMALWLAEGLAALLARVSSRRVLTAGAVLALLVALVLAPAFVRHWDAADLSPHWEAEAFLQTALSQAEPGAVILAAGDQRTFALWYGIYGLNQRPDIAVVNVNLYGFAWYRRTLAETHPDLLPSDYTAVPLEALVGLWAAERSVYAVDDLDLALPGLNETRVGALTKLSP
jgi:hypothetical protein